MAVLQYKIKSLIIKKERAVLDYNVEHRFCGKSEKTGQSELCIHRRVLEGDEITYRLGRRKGSQVMDNRSYEPKIRAVSRTTGVCWKVCMSEE